MTTYRTPDVYIEELSVFPPSVAEVETAIPAFIGYTEKATRVVTGDLANVPLRVKSLLEFESYFGVGAKINVDKVEIDEANNFVGSTLSNSYYLYDSLRLFFDNGGGNCYIVSVGCYPDSIDREKLKAGLYGLRTVDEPTMLLFPDAAALSASDLAAIQKLALQQCGELRDRVALLDTQNDDPRGVTFRNTIGINNLKYGAAYSPWLKVNYGKSVGYTDVRGKISKSGAPITLASLTSEAGLLSLMSKLDDVLGDHAGAVKRVAEVTGAASKTIASRQGELLTAYKSAKTPANMQALFAYLYGLASFADGLVTDAGKVANPDLLHDITDSIGTTLRPALSELIALEKELDGKLAGAYTPQWEHIAHVPSAPEWGTLFSDLSNSPAPSTAGIPSSAEDTAMLDAALAGVNKVFSTVSGAISGYLASAKAYATTYEQSLYEFSSVYRNIIKGINGTMTEVPPSGAVAGVYATVDNARGVWKAPANVSLNGVVAPAYLFDSTETDELNIDAVAGKSINAIRAFSGKGTLVWGARTLAGNDNEWRYVSVRRFFNMVEESVKKSTYWAVFEPNDANTWVKVRGMIENFLTQKWREGALAGATTKEAFFVRCGLGVTMNAQDILEGRMNVEIGMAVVRPAEFIVLKFSHKLQTS